MSQSTNQPLQKLIDDLARRVAGVTGQSAAETAEFAKRYGPMLGREVARLQIARSAKDAAAEQRAQTNLKHLKARAWLDAAVYGVRVQAHLEQAFMAALDFVLKVS